MDSMATKTIDVKLTQYSHGSGCGCKISPQLLENILASSKNQPGMDFPGLLVGNHSNDDAAVFDIGNDRAVISSTDFFMPIVDDPFEFGQIAATNAISDIYAMGGSPLMAIAIFGWPIDKLGPEVAARVIDGGRHACQNAGIPLAGGHSIDAPEPIFGLAVTGQVENRYLKRNNQGTAGCRLYLTKPLGIGILSTAQKKKLLKPQHARLAPDTMCRLNKVGTAFARQFSVKAMTDVTGFGLLGHLCEMCEGGGVHAVIHFDTIPKLDAVDDYLDAGCSPGGTQRNFDSYGHKLGPLSERQKQLLCDPQTSGGLLVAVSADGEDDFLACAGNHGYHLKPIGALIATTAGEPIIKVV